MTAVGPLIVGIPVAVVGHKMITDAEMIQHNFKIKELKKQTISPGKSTHGFVYFQLLEEKEDHPEKCEVHIEVLELGTKQMKNFDIVFEWVRE